MQTFLGSRTLPVCTALWRLPFLEMLVCAAFVFWESRCAQRFGAFQFSSSLDVSRSGASYQMLVCAAFRRHPFSRAHLLALSRARTFSDRNTICTRDPPCRVPCEKLPPHLGSDFTFSDRNTICTRDPPFEKLPPHLGADGTFSERNTICTRDPPCEKLRHTV